MRTGNARRCLFSLVALWALSACATMVPEIDDSVDKSSDPALTSLIDVFQGTCIRAAPSFPEAALRETLADKKPPLAPGLLFVPSATDGRDCRIIVRGYGHSRAIPSIGDVNALAATLQARIGGTLRPARANITGGAQVRSKRKIYNVYGYVNRTGDLTLSVSGG